MWLFFHDKHILALYLSVVDNWTCWARAVRPSVRPSDVESFDAKIVTCHRAIPRPARLDVHVIPYQYQRQKVGRGRGSEPNPRKKTGLEKISSPSSS